MRGRSRFDVAAFAGFAVIWVTAYRHFVFGQEHVFHDTLWGSYTPYAILLQWLDNGFPVGWNPFPDGGEPLYLLSNLFLWAELLVFWLLNQLFRLPVHDLLNLYFSYVLISFAGFCFLLFGAVFHRRVTVFYALTPVLLGGLTIGTFGQYMLGTLYLAPLALLSAYLFVRERSLRYLAWAAFFVAASANHYLPHYLILVLVAFFVSFGLVELAATLGAPLAGLPATVPGWTRGKVWELGLIAALMGAAVAPALYVHGEVRNLISPTRGGVSIGEHGVGHQRPVIVSADRYEYLVHVPQVEPGVAPVYIDYHHSPFYVGWLPVLLAAGSLLLVRDRTYLLFLLTLILLIIAALGEPAGLWAFLQDRMHLLYFRHTFPLALPVTVLLILLSGFAVDRLPLPAGVNFAVVLLTLALCLFGTQGHRHADGLRDRPFDLAPFRYPVERWPYSRRLGEVPFDSEPTITKRASATHPDEDFVLFRTRSYQELLRRDLRLATGSLFVFSEHLAPSPTPRDGQRNEITDGQSPAPRVESRNHAWLLSGRATTTLSLHPDGKSFLVYQHGNPVDLRGHAVEFSACIKSQSPLGVNLVSEPGPLSTLDTYRGTGRWECYGTNFQVGAHAPSVSLAVSVWAEREAIASVDRVRVEILPDLDPDSVLPIPAAVVSAPSPNRIRVQADFPRNGFLVRKENFHPGWMASVDGAPVTIIRWGAVFQAVAVNAGRHTVEFVFRSPYPVLMWLHFFAVIAGYAWFARTLLDGSDPARGRPETGGA